MNKTGLKNLIRKGEGISIEFKECRNRLNKTVFQSICAFLNRNGEDLILGVHDSGRITGIVPESVEQVKKELVTALNNPQKLNPPCYLMPEKVVLEDIRLFIPESSQVHRCNGKIYDRNEDGDFDITSNTNLIEEDIFKCIVPLASEAAMHAAMQANMQDERINKIIRFCEQPRSRQEIQKHLTMKNRDYLRKFILNPLIKRGVLRLTIPDKPRSPNQKYYSPKEKKKR